MLMMYMKSNILKFLSSPVTCLLLMIVYACGLAAATFIEKQLGTETAKVWVYYSPIFIFWQFLMVVNFVAMTWKYQLISRKKWGALLTHLAFIVILGGAMCSHVFSEEGLLHLREGESSNQIAVRAGDKTYFHTLPFDVELVKFTLTRYPGSASPSSFESEVLVHVDGETRRELIFMNNVLDVKGYRFFQASYDKDEHGTILSVNRDVIGRNITYTGYFLLALGLVICILGRNSRFMYLSRQLKKMRSMGVSTLVMIGMLSFSAGMKADKKTMDLNSVVQQLVVSPKHAAAFGALPVQSENGRMIPMNTFSSEVLRKLHKEDTFGKLNSDQFLLSLLAMPDMWMRVPLISVSNKEISAHFDLPEKACSYLQVFNTDGAYKFQEDIEKAYEKMPNQRTRFDKDLMKLDEQVNILHQVFNYQRIHIFPKEGDPNHKWYAPGDDLSVYSGKDSLFVSRIFLWYLGEVQSALKTQDWSKADEVLGMIETYQQAKSQGLDISPKKMQAEIKYNQMNIFRQCKIGYLIAGGLLLVLAFAAMFNDLRKLNWLFWLLLGLVVAVFGFHTYGMGVRWYIAGYAPWSNSYETMVYVAWATVAAGLMFVRRSRITMALATLFGGIILFVSGLNWMDPEISPLVPVLKSPWLMFHVAVIVAAYGFFGICCLLGITNMVVMTLASDKNQGMLQTRIRELTIVNEMAMLIGLALMTIGTFLGAVWANESWGRYWGWDPKETWALITMIVYALVEHLRLVRRWYNAWSFNFLSVMAFCSVLMTFFGVNYFLSGMHSYGENDQVHGIFIYIFVSLAVIVVISAIAYWKYRSKLSNVNQEVE